MTRRQVALLLLAALGAGCRPGGDAEALPQGGDFTLTDQEGRPFPSSSLRGHVTALFFGYTSCPDVCPTTLAKLTAVTRTLGPDARHLRVAYVTVDPARDTPAVMKAHLSMFPITAIGLTGTPDQIADVAGRYAVRYEVEPTESRVGYFVAHSTMLYLLDRDARTRVRLPYEATVEAVTMAVRTLL